MSSMCRALLWINLVRCLVSLWSSSSSSRTTADYGFAVGSYNGTISLIGGYNAPLGLTMYEVDLDEFTDESSPVTANIFGLSQFYAQSSDDILYMISKDSTDLISTYDLETEVFVSSFKNDHIDPGSLACLTSIGDYLFVLGGGMTLGSDSLATFQSLDIITSNWLVTPSMATSRAALACVAHAGHVWALGGATTDALNSTERISTRGDITTNSWEDYEQLLDPVVYARAIGHKHLIYVIGGLLGSTVVDTVQIINTLTHEITRDDLAYAVDATGAIYDDPFLYAFGGRTQVSAVISKETFLFFDTTTEAPTQFPSEAPTKNPSSAPSKAPTGNPSSAPTKYPSGAPTKAPSSNPSDAPSSQPSSAPSDITLDPSKTPTSSPSDAPSAVSSQPSVAPSNAPTEDEEETTQQDDKGGNDGGSKGGSVQDGMGLLIGLSIAAIVVLVILLALGLYYLRKKDRQYEEEKRIKQAVQTQFQAQAMQTGALNEDDVLRQVMALSALEQHRKVSLQAQPPQQVKATKKVDPASGLGAVKEDETKPKAADKETDEKDKEKKEKEDKGKKEEKDKEKGDKALDLLLNTEKQSDANDSGGAMIAVDTADSDDEKAVEMDTVGADEKVKEDKNEDKDKQDNKDEPVLVEMVEKKETEADKDKTESADKDDKEENVDKAKDEKSKEQDDPAPSAIEEP